MAERGTEGSFFSFSRSHACLTSCILRKHSRKHGNALKLIQYKIFIFELTVLFDKFLTLQFKYAVFPKRAVTFLEALVSKCGPLGCCCCCCCCGCCAAVLLLSLSEFPDAPPLLPPDCTAHSTVGNNTN